MSKYSGEEIFSAQLLVVWPDEPVPLRRNSPSQLQLGEAFCDDSYWKVQEPRSKVTDVAAELLKATRISKFSLQNRQRSLVGSPPEIKVKSRGTRVILCVMKVLRKRIKMAGSVELQRPGRSAVTSSN